MQNPGRSQNSIKEQPNRDTRAGSDIHPVYAALFRIADYLGVDTRCVDLSTHPDEELTVLNAAGKFGLRIRQVRLQGDWWKEDGGPFLAYIGANEDPVALIPHSPRRYLLYRAGDRRGTTVNKALATQINQFAFSLYAPFGSDRVSMQQLFHFGLKHFWRQDMVSTLLTGATGSVLGLAVPFMTGLLFDYIVPARQYSQLVFIILLLVLTGFASFVFQITCSFALLRMEGKLDMYLESALWDRILKLPTEFFRDYSAGDLAKRAEGITRIRKTVSGLVVNTSLACIFSLFSLALIFFYSAVAGLSVLICILILIAVMVVFFRALKEPVKKKSLEGGKLEGLMVQLIRGYHKFIVTGSQNVAFALWHKPFSEVKRMEAEINSKSGEMNVILSAFPVVASAVFYLAAYTGLPHISTGSFLAIFAAFNSIMASLVAMSQALNSLLYVLPYYERMRPILETLPEVDASKSNPGNLRGEISLSHVVFRYPGSSRDVISDVSFTIREGEMAALVGGSGSGKSTLLRLLLGFEQPLSGAIFYDGKDLASLNVQEVRSRIGTVIQNAQLMSDSIYKNIIGSSNLSIEDAWEAARLVSLDKDIEEMPMGMHTFLNEGGRTLSGGQRQRILLARALVRKPRIMFLDEATSSLDNSTQAAVTESLHKLKITRVVIAHRLSTIMNADRIFVLDNGRIVQEGSYSELMACPDLFREFAERQMA